MIRTTIGMVSALGIAALALVFAGESALAEEDHKQPCDFLTGGGFIIVNGAKANFGVGGGCKHGAPTWGHLEYVDHGIRLNVHWKTITAYFPDPAEPTTADPENGQPLGGRMVCGTARTNLYGDVDFILRAKDAGEPGINDEFDIRLKKGAMIVYTTEGPGFPHKLAGGGPGGGNIQLHKPNPSTTGFFGGSCPAIS